MRKLVKLIFLALVAVFLVGCGSGGSDNKTNTNSSQTSGIGGIGGIGGGGGVTGGIGSGGNNGTGGGSITPVPSSAEGNFPDFNEYADYAIKTFTYYPTTSAVAANFLQTLSGNGFTYFSSSCYNKTSGTEIAIGCNGAYNGLYGILEAVRTTSSSNNGAMDIPDSLFSSHFATQNVPFIGIELYKNFGISHSSTIFQNYGNSLASQYNFQDVGSLCWQKTENGLTYQWCYGSDDGDIVAAWYIVKTDYYDAFMSLRSGGDGSGANTGGGSGTSVSSSSAEGNFPDFNGYADYTIKTFTYYPTTSGVAANFLQTLSGNGFTYFSSSCYNKTSGTEAAAGCKGAYNGLYGILEAVATTSSSYSRAINIPDSLFSSYFATQNVPFIGIELYKKFGTNYSSETIFQEYGNSLASQYNFRNVGSLCWQKTENGLTYQWCYGSDNGDRAAVWYIVKTDYYDAFMSLRSGGDGSGESNGTGGGTGSGESNGTGGGQTGGGTGGGSSGLCADVDFAAIDTAFPTLNTGSYSLEKNAVHHPLVSVSDYINNKIKPVTSLESRNIPGFDYFYSDSLYTTSVGITQESDGKYSSTISYRDDTMYDRLKPTDAALRFVENVKYLDSAITQTVLDNYITALKNAGFSYGLVNGTDDEYAYIKKSGNCVYEWSGDISSDGSRTLFSWIILDKYLWEL